MSLKDKFRKFIKKNYFLFSICGAALETSYAHAYGRLYGHSYETSSGLHSLGSSRIQKSKKNFLWPKRTETQKITIVRFYIFSVVEHMGDYRVIVSLIETRRILICQFLLKISFFCFEFWVNSFGRKFFSTLISMFFWFSLSYEFTQISVQNEKILQLIRSKLCHCQDFASDKVPSKGSPENLGTFKT